LLQRERARARREAALAAIGRALSRSLEPQSFLNAVLEELGLALEFELGAVYLIEGEEFVLASHRGLSAEFAAKAARNPLDHYILGKVISSGEPLEVREFLSPAMKEEGLKYAAYVPLRTPERPLGVLILGTRSERALRAEELELLEAVGAQLGLALGQAETANASSSTGGSSMRSSWRGSRSGSSGSIGRGGSSIRTRPSGRSSASRGSGPRP
jgi:GAF domain-containing protein